MSVIVYKKYSFKEPAPLTSDQWEYLKRQVVASTAFEIGGDYKVTFSSHYRRSMRHLIIGLATVLGSMLVYSWLFDFVKGQFSWPEYVMGAIFVFFGGMVFLALMQIFLEGPSMATYLTDRKLYFVRMKYAIRHYADYPAFYVAFYGDGKKTVIGLNAPFRNEALSEIGQASGSVDGTLTRVFSWIDRHFWKITLVLLAAFLIKKFVIK